MIELRDITEADKEKLLNWRNQPEVRKYMYTDHIITEEEHDKWFNDVVLNDRSCKYWIIVLDGEDVGSVNLYYIDEKNSRCNWSFYIAKDTRGRGVGLYVEYSVLYYVFEVLKLNRIYGEVFSFNENAIKLFESSGFQIEGRFREHVVKDGIKHDIICVGYLQSDWIKNKSKIEERLHKKGLINER